MQADRKLLTYSNYITADFDNHRITENGNLALIFGYLSYPICCAASKQKIVSPL